MKPTTNPPAGFSGPPPKPRDSSDLYRLLVDRVQDYAIFALDPQGYILSWNAGAERLKGYAITEILGKHFSIFYPPEDVAAGKTVWELDVATKTGQVEDEGWRVRKDGTRFWANVLITALWDDDGTLAGFAKVTRDLTERRAAQERALDDARRIAGEESARVAAESRAEELHKLTVALEEQRKVADTANRAKGEFLAAMSHELRTPLNAIGGFAQLLEMEVHGPVTAEQREQLQRIQRSQRHLLGIINDILNFSRIEAGQITYEIDRIPIQEVLNSVGPMIVPLADAKNLNVHTIECPASLAAHVDRAKLEQILLNLLSNAVKFTEDGGTITLDCGAAENAVWLKVRDSGIGIPAEQLESIFAPFMQVGRGLANPKEGTGLGLAISRDLARAMGGDLAVESEEGVGSTFTVTVPRAE